MLFRMISVHELRLVHHHGVFPINLMKPATTFGDKNRSTLRKDLKTGIRHICRRATPSPYILFQEDRGVTAKSGVSRATSVRESQKMEPGSWQCRVLTVGPRSFQGALRSTWANSAWVNWKPTRICCWALRGILGATTRIAFVVAVVSSAPPLKSKVTGYTCLSKIWFP